MVLLFSPIEPDLISGSFSVGILLWYWEIWYGYKTIGRCLERFYVCDTVLGASSTTAWNMVAMSGRESSAAPWVFSGSYLCLWNVGRPWDMVSSDFHYSQTAALRTYLLVYVEVLYTFPTPNHFLVHHIWFANTTCLLPIELSSKFSPQVLRVRSRQPPSRNMGWTAQALLVLLRTTVRKVTPYRGVGCHCRTWCELACRVCKSKQKHVDYCRWNSKRK